MDLYTFKVDTFFITNTRSVFSDTLHLAYAAFVDGDMVAQKLFRLGDFNNGVYHPDDYVPDAQKGGLARVVINDPMSKVAFNFQLLNAGNVPAGALSGRVSSTADQLAGIGAGLGGAGAKNIKEVLAGTLAASGLFWGAIVLEAFATIYAWLNVDCDGPVAVDQISGPRYVLDAWTDTASQTFQVVEKSYPGIDSPTGCGSNSDYRVSWSLRHWRAWVPVTDVAQPLVAEAGVGAAAHNGAVHAFGVDPDGNLLVARSFTGATWNVSPIPIGFFGFSLSSLPVSAVSFNDRLYVLGIQTDGSITTLAYTSDGGSWTRFASTPGGLRTEMGIATTVFRHRLYVIARDSSTNRLRMTSTDDLVTWDPWADIPEPPLDPAVALVASSVAAATLADTLHIFVVYSAHRRGARRAGASETVLLHNSTLQGSTWTGWREVERGTKLDGGGMPLDVAALAFQSRIYIASRWDTVRVLVGDQESFFNDVIAVNFSEDGDNWSGWRIPLVTQAAGTTAALAGLGNHLYIFAPELSASHNAGHVVWVY